MGIDLTVRGANAIGPINAHHEPERGGATLRFAAAMLLSALICLVLLAADWTGWSDGLLLFVPALAAWLVRRRSIVVSIYLVQVSIYFGLSRIVAGEGRPPFVVAVVTLWVLGLAAGSVLGGRRKREQHGVRWKSPTWAHLIMVGGLIAIQGLLIASGQLGLRAQLTTGLSTPTGISGTLAAVAPTMTVMLVVSALGAQRRVAPAAALAVLEALMLSQSAFRGAATSFFVTLLVAAWVVVPKESAWRRPKRFAAVCVVVTLIAVAAFVIGARVRDSAATALGQSSEGTQLFTPAQALPSIANRLDESAALERAVELRDEVSVQEAVSWKAQVQGLIPRFLWPEKPTVDYGYRVSVAIYGIDSGNNSATITTIGDVLINFKLYGLVLSAILLGLALSFGERHLPGGGGPLALAIAAGLASFVATQELPLIGAVVGVIRNALLTMALWLLCSALFSAAGDGDREPRWRRRASEPEGRPVGGQPLRAQRT